MDPEDYRFSSTEFYSLEERDVWEAIAIHKLAKHVFGDDPGAAAEFSDAIQPDVLSRGPERRWKITNFVRGFTAAGVDQIAPAIPGPMLQTHCEQRAAYLAKIGQRPSDTDYAEVKPLFETTNSVWTRWTAMESGTNIPLERSKAGSRDFDINIDGVAHCGMLPDFIQDLKNVGLTPDDLKALNRSSLDYVTMWSIAEIRSLAIRK